MASSGCTLHAAPIAATPVGLVSAGLSLWPGNALSFLAGGGPGVRLRPDSSPCPCIPHVTDLGEISCHSRVLAGQRSAQSIREAGRVPTEAGVQTVGAHRRETGHEGLPVGPLYGGMATR